LSNCHYRRPVAKDKRDLAAAGNGRLTAPAAAAPNAGRMLTRLAVLLFTSLILAGCAVAALPCRVTADVVDVIPVAGAVAAAPFDACAGIIDH
jgi:hypothetical protein